MSQNVLERNQEMIRISQLKLKVGHTRDELSEEIIRQAHGKKPLSWHIVRKSVDARKKPQLFYVYKKVNGRSHLLKNMSFHIIKNLRFLIQRE